MEQYNILWLYDDLLDLYGDSGNILLVKKRLLQSGASVNIVTKSIYDTIDYADINMVYVGAGKAKNLVRAAKHFIKYKKDTLKAIEDGVVFFVTGNARLLFGKSFVMPNGEVIEGIELFAYTARETGNVFISDVVAHLVDDVSTKTYGFINRTAHIDDNDSNFLFAVEKGAGDNEYSKEYEGNHYKNYFGTWQLGPVLVKNPELLKKILSLVAPQLPLDYDDTLERKAAELTLREFD